MITFHFNMAERLLLVLMCVTLVYSDTNTFRNPILDGDCPDPWILRHNGTYLFTYTLHTEIKVFQSNTLENWRGAKNSTVYRPENNEYIELWAPEIHEIKGNLYLYFTATTNPNGTEGHRMYVLKADDPAQPLGKWTWMGQVRDTARDWWAIDGTVFQPANGKLFFIWAGRWEDPDWTKDHLLQLLIAEMSDPVTLVPGSTALLNRPSLPFEMHGDAVHYGVSEGPAVVESGENYYLLYSGSSTWTNDYCLGMLRINQSADPMKSESWYKHQEPVFVKNVEEGVFGPGHASFTQSLDGTEHWMVYHAMYKSFEKDNERTSRIQRFTIQSDGTPSFPTAAGYGQDLLKPGSSSITPAPSTGTRVESGFTFLAFISVAMMLCAV